MDPLDNRVQEYAWGSRTAIARLLGQPTPSPRPQAELWLGAHPVASSRVERDGRWESLLDVIARRPEAELGPGVVARFGPHLPFLFKVLAADTPLSLQAHPDAKQAALGFEAEERAGVPLDAPRRHYRDRNHKPELLCALEPFEMLSGFRTVADTARLLKALRIAGGTEHGVDLELESSPGGLGRLVSALFATTGEHRARLVTAVVEACGRHAVARGEFEKECAWVLRIASLYPGDIGVAVALLLNLVRLDPGHAVYLPAGNLHAYLSGTGIEIMANSDNVIRGGLTPKPVDPAELLRVLGFHDGPIDVIVPKGEGPEAFYETPAAEFRLSRVSLGASSGAVTPDRRGPEILLCTEGRATATARGGAARTLEKGASLFVPALAPAYALDGSATIYRATVGNF